MSQLQDICDWELRGAVNGNVAKNPNLSNQTSRQVTRGKDAHALMSAQDLLECKNKQKSTTTWKEGRAALCPAGCCKSAVSYFSSKSTVYIVVLEQRSCMTAPHPTSSPHPCPKAAW